MNYYLDSPEWKYLFRSAIDWDTILPLYYPTFPTSNGFANKEELLSFFEQVLETTGKWSGETLKARAKELDEVGCARALPDGSVELLEPIKKTYAEAKQFEVFGTCVDEKYGGLGLPISVGMFLFEQTARACISTSTQLGFYTSIADMIERFCDEETKDRLLPQIIRGEISGSMCLTEPDAGSDVGALRTSAEKQTNGTYCGLKNDIKCNQSNNQLDPCTQCGHSLVDSITLLANLELYEGDRFRCQKCSYFNTGETYCFKCGHQIIA